MAKKTTRKKPVRLVRNKFLTGILTLLPIYITYLLLRFIIGIAPDIPYLRTIPFFNDNEILTNIIEFLGALLVIFFIGLVISNVLGKRLFTLFENIMEKLPLINTIYTSSRQIMQTLTMPGKGNFKQVVLIEYPRKGLWTLAFVTAYSKSKSGEQYIHVFLPTTPNPTSGFMLFIKEKDVRPSGLSIEEGLKTLISGGMISSEKNQLP
ncbi:MAG: DUF502 domain-containing protein [Candidatus Marinimicrobia bacterium]|nr:DUF502 domain-containing protein [Candidatus Neomarinimicrobiota bacterium]